MSNATPTGYVPRHRGLMFNGEENKYELWEVKFMGYRSDGVTLMGGVTLMI